MVKNNFWKVFWVVFVVIVVGVGYWFVVPLFVDKEISKTINFHKDEGTVKLIKSGDKYFVRF